MWNIGMLYELQSLGLNNEAYHGVEIKTCLRVKQKMHPIQTPTRAYDGDIP